MRTTIRKIYLSAARATSVSTFCNIYTRFIIIIAEITYLNSILWGVMIISKSDYMLYLKHPAWLWVKKHDPSKIPPIDAATQAMFDTGYAFEPYVESLFEGAVRLGFDNYDEYRSLPVRTQHALEQGAKALIQPRFEWRNFTCISDIVQVVDGKTVDLYEIKSSTSVKPEHILDLAFQVAVLDGCGYEVREVYVAHVNNRYVRQGDVDPRQLSTIVNVTERVMEEYETTLDTMQQALAVAVQTQMPDPDPSFAGLGARKDWLRIYENIFPSPPTVWPEDTEPVIDHDEIKQFLDGLKYPLYFLDYETMQGLVPYFDGQRPYQQIPFQYSLHILRQPGGELEHHEYLHAENSDPGRAVAERLVQDLGSSGTIIVWNQSFEKTRNVEMGQMYSEHAEAMQAINERVVDLMVPFKAKWYDDPRFEGSASIKNVLPVVCPELSYKDLGIQDGNTAQRFWMAAVLDGTRDTEKQQILDDLIEYCKLDTLAMVEIYKKLGDIVRREN